MDKSYEVQVLLNAGTKNECWKSISPTGGEPYRFITKEAAEWHLIKGYGRIDSAGRTIRRVREVNLQPNISLT